MKPKLTYTHYTQGLHQGFPGYRIEFQGNKLKISEMTDLVYNLTSHRRRIHKQKQVPVWVTAKNLNYPLTPTMTGVLQPIKDQQFFILLEVDGTNGYKQWYSFADYLIVRLEGEKWAAFACQEIWYTPIKHIDPPFVGKPVLFLDVKEVTRSVIVDFLQRSPQPWRILEEVKRTFSEEIIT